MTPRIKSRGELEREILQEMKHDYVGLWDIAHLVRTELGYANEGTIYEITFDIIRDMLMQELIRPGVATDKGDFEPWPTDPIESLPIIAQKWRSLGRRPTVGDIAWFDLTEWGEKVASTD
jgi:hypothetical protein